MRINRELSERLAEIVGAENRNCYRNSILTLFTLEIEGETNKLYYVEGYAVAYLPEEHGWLGFNDEIVDVTYFGRNIRHRSDGTLQPHEPPESCSYFTCRKYSFSEIRRRVHSLKKLPLFLGEGREGKERMSKAMVEAYASMGADLQTWVRFPSRNSSWQFTESLFKG